MLANEFIRLPVQFLGSLPSGTPRWGKGHKDAMRRWYRRHIAVVGPTQEMPIWGAAFEDLRPDIKPSHREAFARLRVHNLMVYLETVQAD